MVKWHAIFLAISLPLFGGIAENGLSALAQKDQDGQKNSINHVKPKLEPESIVMLGDLCCDKDNSDPFNQILEGLIKKRPEASLPKEQIETVVQNLSTDNRHSLLQSLLSKYSSKESLLINNDTIMQLFDNQPKETQVTLLSTLIKSYSQSFAIQEDSFIELFDAQSEEAQEKLLLSLLQKYNDKQLQTYVSEVLKHKSYRDLLKVAASETCDEVLAKARPSYTEAIPFTAALNFLNLPDFYNPATKNSLFNRGHFHDFNTFEQISLFVAPYGYFLDFDQGNKTTFNLYSIGLGIGGDYTFLEKITVGLGAAYSFSELHFKENEEQAKINAFYIGPYVGYLFPRGALSLMALGTLNAIETKRETHFFKERIAEAREAHSYYKSWDVAGRLEGLFFQPIGEDFYLNPSARIDYIYVLQEENKEFLDKKSSLHVQDSSDSFMQTRLSLELKREVYKPKLGFVVPSLIFAWNHFIPLSAGSYRYSISGCDKVVGAERLLKPWDTFSYGGRLALIFKKGFYLSLDYELSHGTSQIQHKGTVRASLSW